MPIRLFVRTVCHLWHADYIVCMGESMSIFIRRFVKLKCAYGDLRILTISRIKKYFFVLILFRNLVLSIHLTTCRSMFSEANTCARIAGSGENCCQLAGSMLYTTEKSRAVRKKNAVFVRRLWAFRRHWQKCEKQMELEVDSGGGRGQSTILTLMSKVRWAEGCN